MNLYLAIEVSSRELDSKLLLAVLAASRGHEVILSSITEIIFGLKKNKLSPGIFHTKSLTPSKKKIEYHQYIIDNGSIITSMDEEGGFLLKNQTEFIKKRFSQKSVDQVSAVFGWGRDVDLLKSEYFKSSHKFFKTGSPRIDLNKSILNSYWPKPKKIPKRPYLLLSSNFNCTYNRPFYEVINKFKVSGFYERYPDLFRNQFEQYSEEFLMLYAFIEAIKNIAEKSDGFDIVVRPHPREPIEAWKIFLEDVPNIHIIKDDAIMPWIKNAFALMHNGCSTAVEAAVAGIPVISYVPFEQKYFQKEFSNKIGYKVKNGDELLKLTNLIFKDSQKNELVESSVNKSYEILSERIFIDKEKLSAEKIIDVWESLNTKEISNSNNLVNFKLSLKITNLKKFLKKNLQFMFPEKHNHIFLDNKFPPLNENEVKIKVKRLQNTLGIKTDLVCKVFSDRTILIKPR